MDTQTICHRLKKKVVSAIGQKENYDLTQRRNMFMLIESQKEVEKTQRIKEEIEQDIEKYVPIPVKIEREQKNEWKGK